MRSSAARSSTFHRSIRDQKAADVTSGGLGCWRGAASIAAGLISALVVRATGAGATLGALWTGGCAGG
jgi:hypothetical protein